MIRYNPKSWTSLILHSYSRQVIKTLFPGMLGMGALTAVVCYIELVVLEQPLEISNVVHSLLGFVLSLFLVFRTNTAYDRWWEGRKQWGALVNTTRMLAIRMEAWVGQGDDRNFFRDAIAAFPAALRDHLRGKVDVAHFPEWQKFAGDDLEGREHIPNAIASTLSTRIARLVAEGRLSGEQQLLADGDVGKMVDILGACERILKTPIPYSYSMYLKKFIFLYVVTLPLGFVATFQWWTIPVVMGIFYILVAVELIAEEIEDPFGKDENDLPTDGLTETMQRNVREIFKES